MILASREALEMPAKGSAPRTGRRMSLRLLASAAVAAGALVAVTAGGSEMPAAQAAVRPPVQVTGDQLSSALLPASYFGPGYQVGIGFGSGSKLDDEPASMKPATMSCYLLGTVVVTNFGDTAYATTSDSPAGTTGQTYQQMIFQFPSYRASAAFYSTEEARDARCTSYSSPAPASFSISVRQYVVKTHVGDHQAFLIVQSMTYAGVAGVSKVYWLEIIDGADVFTVQTFSTANSPATHPTAAAAAGQLIARVSALR
jgi:hypothetical protein